MLLEKLNFLQTIARIIDYHDLLCKEVNRLYRCGFRKFSQIKMLFFAILKIMHVMLFEYFSFSIYDLYHQNILYLNFVMINFEIL